MRIKAFDFFCGAGGLTRGLLDIGFDVKAGFDVDINCRKSYIENNPGVDFVCKDISKISGIMLRKIARAKSFDKFLFAGCAPCQPFSKQRKGEKKERDARLLTQFSRLVEECIPGFVLIENVPGIAKVPGFSAFKRFLLALEQLGYNYAFGVLDAKYFGVPQQRRRLVLIAARGIIPSLPKGNYGTTLRPLKTVRQTISRFPPIKEGQSHNDMPNHTAASLTPINLKRLKSTPHDGGDRRSWSVPLWLRCHKGQYYGHTDVYGRMKWDEPSPTLTGRCNSLSNGRYGHPEQDRAISLREAAALQTFPDNYEFFGSNTHIAHQIGNAIPVKLARELGKHIIDISTAKAVLAR